MNLECHKMFLVPHSNYFAMDIFENKIYFIKENKFMNKE